jgi:hypothetical protein
MEVYISEPVHPDFRRLRTAKTRLFLGKAAIFACGVPGNLLCSWQPFVAETRPNLAQNSS